MRYGKRRAKMVLAALAFSTLAGLRQLDGQESKPVLLDVTATHYYIGGEEKYQYLRVYSDRTAEAEVLKRKAMFEKTQIEKKKIILSQQDFAYLTDFLNSGKTAQLERHYKQRVGLVLDDFEAWDIRLQTSKGQEELTVVAFEPDAASRNNKPYPAELVKLGCLADTFRAQAVGSEVQRDRECGKVGIK